MIRQSARTARTVSTSRSQRDVIHAQGHSRSNQNGTSTRSGRVWVIGPGFLPSPGCACRGWCRRSQTEEVLLDGPVGFGGAPGDLDQLSEAEERVVAVGGVDEAGEDLGGDLYIGGGSVAVDRVGDGE